MPINFLPDRANSILDLKSADFSLTATEQAALMLIAESAQDVKSIKDFKKWVPDAVALFFPHEMLICGAGSVVGVNIKIERVLGVGYPEEFLAGLSTSTDLIERPVLRRWLAENKPQLVDECMVETHLSALEQDEVRMLNLVNIAAYGVLDFSIGRGTYFSFSRIPGPVTTRHGKLLEMIVPYLHHALLRATQTMPGTASVVEQQLALLTPKELEILKYVEVGLTNRQIAQKLSRSELTIQTQVHSLLKKLGVPNRAAAGSLMRGALTANERTNTTAS